MLQKSILTLGTLLFFLISSNTYAQDALPATGGEATGGGGTVSYTIGQVLYNTYNGPSNSEAQGVQQPYEISTITALFQQAGISLECDVFPNPVINYLQLKVDNYDLEGLSYSLYNATGKRLQQQSVLENLTQIDMESYPSAVYFLHVNQEENTIQTFKIIKNNN